MRTLAAIVGLGLVLMTGVAYAERDEDVQAPRSQDVQSARSDEVQAPRGQDVNGPRADEAQAVREAP